MKRILSALLCLALIALPLLLRCIPALAEETEITAVNNTSKMVTLILTDTVK